VIRLAAPGSWAPEMAALREALREALRGQPEA
jgi:hypothetical protein